MNKSKIAAMMISLPLMVQAQGGNLKNNCHTVGQRIAGAVHQLEEIAADEKLISVQIPIIGTTEFQSCVAKEIVTITKRRYTVERYSARGVQEKVVFQINYNQNYRP